MAGHFLGTGAHFMQGRCRQFDFPVLRVHARADFPGHLCRRVGGVAGVQGRLLDIADDGLQFVEKAIEALRQ
ncbi:hypothetical protein D3C80_2031830 [compost metagenome]